MLRNMIGEFFLFLFINKSIIFYVVFTLPLLISNCFLKYFCLAKSLILVSLLLKTYNIYFKGVARKKVSFKPTLLFFNRFKYSFRNTSFFNKFRLDRDALSKGACLLLIPSNVELILALLSFTALVTKLQESTVTILAR